MKKKLGSEIFHIDVKIFSFAQNKRLKVFAPGVAAAALHGC